MPEIRDRAVSKINTELSIMLDGWEHQWVIVGRKPTREEIIKAYTEKILSLPELAVVDRGAELPENPYDKNYHTSEEKVRWIIHNNAHQDMLNAGWVKEVKDG